MARAAEISFTPPLMASIIPPKPSAEAEANAFGAAGNPAARTRVGEDPLSEPPVEKVRDAHGRLVSKKRANAPYLAYSKWKTEQEAKEADKARRRKEREDKRAKGEPIDDDEYTDLDEEEDSAIWALFKVFVVMLVFFGIAGRFVTGGFFWGYNGKWVQPKTYWPASNKIFTEVELAKYDGTDPSLPIYLAIDSNVYDVSASARIYGQPHGSYRHMSGVDAARAFATGCFQLHRTHDTRGLSEEALKSIDHWKEFFANSEKYFYVGKVVHPPIDPNSPIPPPCDAQGNAVPTANPADIAGHRETADAAGKAKAEL